jgi:DsrE/DsrF-like family
VPYGTEVIFTKEFPGNLGRKHVAKYMLIESRDPFESSDVVQFCDLAQALKNSGNDVTVYLVQNAVLPARSGARADALGTMLAKGIKVLADDFSLRERAIPAQRLVHGVLPASLDAVVDAMAQGVRTVWH